MPNRVFVTKVAAREDLAPAISSAFDFLRWSENVPASSTVFVKPNLTWKEPLAGVTTSPAFLRAFLTELRPRVQRVIVGESNGGYHSFAAEDAFASHGLYALRSELDLEVVNLSKGPTAPVQCQTRRGKIAVELPTLLLEGIDQFVTLPVPKIHAMTGVSVALKNQWGCIPGTMRLRLHSVFADVLNEVNRRVGLGYAFCDGTTMLDITGPMIGKPVRKDLLIAGNPAGAASAIACRIMGIDPWSIAHQRTAQRAGLFPAASDEIECNRPWQEFADHRFTLQLNLVARVAKLAFHSRFLTTMIYDSTVADIAHRVLYAVRRNPLVARLLYGEWGPPAIEGRRQ
jgi:uncharacterized protein (DUF362 family)